jgi:tripartite-type tricarboxylate transporter receptor subunit TctC
MQKWAGWPAFCLSLSAFSILALSIPVPAHAQRFSDRPVTIVVPTTPGTSMDFLARFVADELKQRWGQTVVVENRAGASHTIAIRMVAGAQPDGLTFLMEANTLTTNVGFFKTMPYDPVTSLTPVIEMARGSMALAIHPSVKADTIKEFVALAKTKPNEFNYASTGPGTPQHLAMALFDSRAGIQMNHIPYPGSAGATRELVGGFINAMFIPSHQAEPLYHAKQIKLLAVSGSQRLSNAPEVPTLSEAGFDGVDVDSWYGLLGPAKLPANIVARFNAVITDILASPKYKAVFAAQGLRVAGGTPEAFAALIASDVERWTRVVKEAGIVTQ